MLNISAQNFNQLIQSFSTTELEKMVEQYPYFHQAHLLLAKKYQLEGNAKFDGQLQTAALYSQNKELLYELFAPKREKTTVEAQPSQTPVFEPLATFNYDTKTKEETEPVKPEDKPSEEPITATEETQAIVSLESKEVLPATVNVMQQEIVLTETAKKETEEQEETTQPINEDETHSFDEWLQIFSKQKIAQAKELLDRNPEVSEADKELEQIIQEGTVVDYLHNVVEEETHYAKGLDTFIEGQIERKKRKTAKPAKESETTIPADIVTETLARLYEDQKKYVKAIQAYETLTLKFPEKSDLFAARIKYLKQLL